MKRFNSILLLAACAASLSLASCWPSDVSVGYDVGYDVATGYVNVSSTYPFGITSPWWDGPIYNSPVFVPQPLAPRPVGGGGITPPPRPQPGPVVGPGLRPGIGSNPGPVILPDNRPVEPATGSPLRPGSRR